MVFLAYVQTFSVPSNGSSLDKGEINRIFLGKTRAFPNGKDALPISVDKSNNIYEEFSKNVLCGEDLVFYTIWR